MRLLFVIAVTVLAAREVTTDCGISLNITDNGGSSTYRCCEPIGSLWVPFLYLYLNGNQLDRVGEVHNNCDSTSIPNSIGHYGTKVVCSASLVTRLNNGTIHFDDNCDNKTLTHGAPSYSSSSALTHSPSSALTHSPSSALTHSPSSTTLPTTTWTSIDISGVPIIETGPTPDRSTMIPSQPSSPSMPVIIGISSVVILGGVLTVLVATICFVVYCCCKEKQKRDNSSTHSSHQVSSTTSQSSSTTPPSSPTTPPSSPTTPPLASPATPTPTTVYTQEIKEGESTQQVGGRGQRMPQYLRGINTEQDEQHLKPAVLTHNETVEIRLPMELQFDNNDPSTLNETQKSSASEVCAIEIDLPSSPLPAEETGSTRFILDGEKVYEELADSPCSSQETEQTETWLNEATTSGSQGPSSPSPVLKRSHSHPMEEDCKDTEDGNTVHVAQNRVLYRRLSINVDCLGHVAVV